MGAVHKEWEGTGLEEGRPSYLTKKKGVEVRTVFWNCQGQWLDTVQKVCDFTVWEMKLESLLNTNEIYYRPVGRRHHGNSFPYIENIQTCFSKDWHWWETSSQEHIHWSPEMCLLIDKWWHKEKTGGEQKNEKNCTFFWMLIYLKVI